MANLTRRIVRVFLASPSDLLPERKLTRTVVDEVNRGLTDLGFQLELYAWEDESPGAGRPQDLINQHLDACDVFLGVLWKRWGQPTGTHESGFHEEFERALARFTRGGVPKVWLWLKEVKKDDRTDAGPQLAKVLAFRDRLKSEAKVLYQEFTDESDYETRLRITLERHLVAISRPESVAGAMRAPEPTSTSPAPVAARPPPRHSVSPLGE